MHKPHLSSGGRYPVLRSLGILYLIGGTVSAVAALGTAVWAMIAGPGDLMDRMILAVGVLAAGFFVTITAFAVAEVLKLFIDVEQNTRMQTRTQPTTAGGDGVKPGGRLAALDEETAELALMRGH